MNLTHANKIASRILEELAPLCHPGFCTIAGSIRRGCVQVNDIDLVCVPLDQYAFRARVLRNSVAIQDGPTNLLVRLQNNVQLDIFMARPATQDLLDKRPTNYGSLLLCRTGSREHNIKLIEHAKKLGLRWNPYEGVYQEIGTVGSRCPILIASETEEQIFRALKMDYIEPKDRS